MSAAVRIVGVVLVSFALARGSAASPPLTLEPRTLETMNGTKIQAKLGRLMVPENRAVSGSRLIPIRFLRLESTAAKPRAPLFYLEGGPGAAAVTESKHAVEFWSQFLPVCDVVLIDQRGVRDSALAWKWDGSPPMSYFLNADSALHHEISMSRRAAAAITARGVDLTGYTTVESAADLDALREALGLERVSLLGFSYGTHLGCAYLRKFGAHVESAILFGLEGPDQTYKLPWAMDVQFQRLALLAARDARIAKHIPDLVALYDRVVAKLAKRPMLVSVPAPSGRDTVRIPIGPFGLRYILRFDVGDATDLIVFPRLLWSIDHGDPSVLSWFVRKRAGGALGVHSMAMMMDASSGATRGRLALIESQAGTSRFADVVNFPFPDVAAAWPVRDLGDAYRSPVVTDVRTLLISGEYDFNTPPYQSEEFRWGAPNAVHLQVANAGHEQTWFQNDTVVPVVRDFLAGQDVKDRKITYPSMRFVPLEGTDPSVGHPSAPK